MPDPAVALRDRLVGFVRARVPADDVDDVVQEVYVRLARGTEHVESLSGYVHQVARSAIADLHRRRARDARLADGLEPPTRAAPEGPAARVASWLGPMVDALDEPLATTLRLAELDGVSHREIADRLGVPRSTVTSRVKRGRERLREALTRCCAIELDARGGVMGFAARRDPGCCE